MSDFTLPNLLGRQFGSPQFDLLSEENRARTLNRDVECNYCQSLSNLTEDRSTTNKRRSDGKA